MKKRGLDLIREYLYINARGQYRAYGQSFMSDSQYDLLHRYLVDNGLAKEWTDRSYDDDPKQKPKQSDGKEYDSLNDEKSYSISSVYSEEELEPFLNKWRGHEMMLSAKMDGINCKALMCKSSLVSIALSRGRAADSTDYTEAIRKTLNVRIAKEKLVDGAKIVGECFVPNEHLERFRRTYDSNKHKTPKSTASSILHNPQRYDVYDAQCMKYYVFSAEIPDVNRVSDMYEHVSGLGFDTPPYFVLPEFDGTYQQLVPYLNELHRIIEESGLPTDGVVLEVNDRTVPADEKGSYLSTQIAIKFGHWKAEQYKGIVTDIIMEQGKSLCSCKLEIEPLVTSDGSEARVINAFNFGYIVDNNITIGSEIEFERNSGAVNVFKCERR